MDTHKIMEAYAKLKEGVEGVGPLIKREMWAYGLFSNVVRLSIKVNEKRMRGEEWHTDDFEIWFGFRVEEGEQYHYTPEKGVWEKEK
jgi:hypothetical protein